MASELKQGESFGTGDGRDKTGVAEHVSTDADFGADETGCDPRLECHPHAGHASCRRPDSIRLALWGGRQDANAKVLIVFAPGKPPTATYATAGPVKAPEKK